MRTEFAIINELALLQYQAVDEHGMLFFRHVLYERRHPRFLEGWIVSVLLGLGVYEFLDIEHDIVPRKAVMDDFGNLVRVP